MQSIVVIGGGFAGLNAALAAARVGDGKLSVTMISRDPWMTIRPRLYEANPETLRVNLLPTLTTVDATFVAGEAASINKNQVMLANGTEVRFDRLVLATGSEMSVSRFPGAERMHSIDQWSAACAFDARIAALNKSATPTLVVVGAGFTGLELALELRDRIALHHGEDMAERASIVLVDSSPTLGETLGMGLQNTIRDAVQAARIQTRLGTRIESITPTAVVLQTGEQLSCDIVVACTGLRATPILRGIAGERDSSGRVMVDAALRVPEQPNVFVAGDAAHAVPEPGRTTLLSCQHALTLGKFAGENAARDVLGQPLIPYSQPRYVTCLALGRSGALFSEGWDRVPKLTGESAKSIKTDINTRWIYPPEGSREDILAATRL